MELILSGKCLNAEEAKQLHIVSQVYTSNEELMNEAQRLAKRVAKMSPEAVETAKYFVKKAVDGKYDLLEERQDFCKIAVTPTAQKLISGRLERQMRQKSLAREPSHLRVVQTKQ